MNQGILPDFLRSANPRGQGPAISNGKSKPSKSKKGKKSQKKLTPTTSQAAVGPKYLERWLHEQQASYYRHLDLKGHQATTTDDYISCAMNAYETRQP
jgi:hypothetical protein